MVGIISSLHGAVLIPWKLPMLLEGENLAILIRLLCWYTVLARACIRFCYSVLWHELLLQAAAAHSELSSAFHSRAIMFTCHASG